MLISIALNIIKFYQRYIRCWIPASCIYKPTCSEYAQEAIVKYGCFRGSLKALARLLRCHPFSGRSRFDPVK